jgi:hypothetical protein
MNVVFLEVVKKLNEKFNLTPILSGSFGLNKVIGSSFECSDIDFLVPGKFVTSNWQELFDAMTEIGFELVDLSEHEFSREAVKVAFAGEEDLGQFSGINNTSLGKVEEDGSMYRQFSANQILALYEASLQDSYRQKKKQGADKEKIIAIKKYLKL